MIKRILIVNDDGIDAFGLGVLERVARQIGEEVWVVAPKSEQSGMACALSYSDPIRLLPKGENRFAVDGTPVDCVMVAVSHLMKDEPPHLILSGVNCGQNIGDGLIYSGTVGAALQGSISGIPSIALSQAFGIGGVEEMNWRTAEHFAPSLITKLYESGFSKNMAFNVNFPDRAIDGVEGIALTQQGSIEHPMLKTVPRKDLRNRTYYWMGFNPYISVPAKGSDRHAVSSGRISITPIQINLTHREIYHDLKARFGNFDSIFNSDIVVENH